MRAVNESRFRFRLPRDFNLRSMDDLILQSSGNKEADLRRLRPRLTRALKLFLFLEQSRSYAYAVMNYKRKMNIYSEQYSPIPALPTHLAVFK